MPLPPPISSATVDGYTFTLADRMLRTGTEEQLTLTVERDGKPETGLQPYLGAHGHPVALRKPELGSGW